VSDFIQTAAIKWAQGSKHGRSSRECCSLISLESDSIARVENFVVCEAAFSGPASAARCYPFSMFVTGGGLISYGPDPVLPLDASARVEILSARSAGRRSPLVMAASISRIKDLVITVSHHRMHHSSIDK
jgi:hypothetical protein